MAGTGYLVAFIIIQLLAPKLKPALVERSGVEVIPKV